MKPSSLPIVASANTLGEVMAGASFRVPNFQRPYAWREEEVEELWEDLVVEGTGAADSAPFHFFGTLLTVDSRESVSPQGSPLEILDGQQRLATFTLLLVAVDRELEEVEESPEATSRVRQSAGETRTRIKDVIYKSAPQEVRRLELRSDEDAVLSNILHGNPPGASRLGDAFRVLHSAVRSLSENSEDRARDLQHLVSTILDRSMVIHARCIHGFDSFAVFSTLNARGLALTAAQILRARSLGLVAGMGHAVEEATKAAWDRVEALGEEGDRFLQYYMIMREGSRIQAKSVVREFDKVLKKVKSEDRPPEAFADLAVQVENLASLFDDIRQGSWPVVSPTVSDWRKNRLRLLVRQLGVKQTLPLIMSAAYRVPDTLAETIDVVERAAFVALICLPNQTKWGDFLFERANKIFAEQLTPDSLKADVREFFMQQLGNPSKALGENLQIQLRFGGKRKTQLRYFLTSLNDYGFPNRSGMPTKPDEQADWNLGKIQIEHISAIALADGVTTDDKNRLGNLTPLYGPTNASVGNQPFSAKKQGYHDSPLRMTRELTELDEWDVSSIRKRETEMIHFAVKLFCKHMTI